MSNRISTNYYYELKAKELAIQLESAKLFFKDHKPSYGFTGEAILRDFLSQNLPARFKVSQGFVQTLDDKLSRQCDIIIYDSDNYAPTAIFGEIEIIPSQAVKAVIEVKTSIIRQSFQAVLQYFEDLGEFGIKNKFLFVFNSVSARTMQGYFSKNKRKPDIITDSNGLKYDHGCEQYLPNGIVSLDKNYYYHLEYVQDSLIPPEIAEKIGIEGCDMIGYNAWQLTYVNEKNISRVSALQLFLSDLFASFGVNNYEHIDYDSVMHMCTIHSFGLWNL